MCDIEIDAWVNVLGESLLARSTAPMTGSFRDGDCDTRAEDHGSHTIRVEMTADFLAFSREAGNDLSMPCQSALKRHPAKPGTSEHWLFASSASASSAIV